MQKASVRSVATILPMMITAVGLSSCASSGPKATHQKQVERETVVTVESIDVPERLVTVRSASGDRSTYYVAESIKDFPQAKVGDKVRIRYRESYAFRVMSPGESAPGLEVTTETSRDKTVTPTRSAKTEVKAMVRIEEVTKDGKVVTFTGPRGRRTVNILDPALQEYVRKLHTGDHVEVTYNEALALSIVGV